MQRSSSAPRSRPPLDPFWSLPTSYRTGGAFGRARRPRNLSRRSGYKPTRSNQHDPGPLTAGSYRTTRTMKQSTLLPHIIVDPHCRCAPAHDGLCTRTIRTARPRVCNVRGLTSAMRDGLASDLQREGHYHIAFACVPAGILHLEATDPHTARIRPTSGTDAGCASSDRTEHHSLVDHVTTQCR